MSKKESIGKRLSKYSVLFVVILMIGSGIAMFVGNTSLGKAREYKGHRFESIDNKWVTEIDGVEHAFYFFPEDIKEYCEKTFFFKEKPMGVMTFNPEIQSQALSLIRFRLDGMENFYLGTATTTENEYGFPILGCENASSEIPMIVFEPYQEGKEHELQPDCLTLYSDDEQERLMYGESMIYNVLGIC